MADRSGSLAGLVLNGRYRLVEPLATGGMGTVWRAHDDLLGRPIAVKEVALPPGLDGPEQDTLRARTLREAQAAARLRHPGIVTVYDVVEQDGRPWIVMELVVSRSLADSLRDRGALPAREVAAIGLRVLDALAVAHAAGILHRDVKPGNVLLAEDGRVVLTDFGIATLTGDVTLTRTGQLLGSPAYIAPERGRGGRPGPEADLWSLGAMLYAAVEGTPPFQRDGALQTLTAAIFDETPEPRQAGPLRDVIVGLLSKDPAQRPDAATARQMLQRAATAAEPRSVEPLAPVEARSAEPAAPVEPLAPVEPQSAEPRSAEPLAPAADIPDSPSVTELLARPVVAAGRGVRRRAWWFAVPALVLVGALVWLVLTPGGNDPGGGPAAQGSTGTGGTGTAPGQPADRPSGSTGSGQASASPTGTGGGSAAIPAGFVRYRDPTGFTVAIPTGWQRVRNDPRVDFREPGGGRFLRIDQTTTPAADPYLDWVKQERQVSGQLDGYRLIRLKRIDYRGWPAADWEFGTSGGGGTHVLNRNLITGRRAYALYWSTPDGQWSDPRSQEIFAVAARTFTPAG